MNVHYSSQSDDWATPKEFYRRLNAIFNFTLDPCADIFNKTCAKFYTKEDDGLSKSWDGERVFMNPPYGRNIGAWVKKASEAKALVVCLIPARTDTIWWHEYVIKGGGQVTFLKGRLYFGDEAGQAPFPSAIVIFTGGAIKNK